MVSVFAATREDISREWDDKDDFCPPTNVSIFSMFFRQFLNAEGGAS